MKKGGDRKRKTELAMICQQSIKKRKQKSSAGGAKPETETSEKLRPRGGFIGWGKSSTGNLNNNRRKERFPVEE